MVAATRFVGVWVKVRGWVRVRVKVRVRVRVRVHLILSRRPNLILNPVAAFVFNSVQNKYNTGEIYKNHVQHNNVLPL
jgi:hypothetical protein